MSPIDLRPMFQLWIPVNRFARLIKYILSFYLDRECRDILFNHSNDWDL